MIAKWVWGESNGSEVRRIGLGCALMIAAAMTTSSANAQILQDPCDTCGIALGAPLPEGIYFVDLENYGKRDGQTSNLGVNLPIVAWSTPFSFYNSRLEIFYASPITHIDGEINRVDVYSQTLIGGVAHDFGNGFNGAFFIGADSPDNFTNAGRGALLDLRAALSYVKDGYDLTLQASYGGNLGGRVTGLAPDGTLGGFDDALLVNYTATKKFGKLEAGIVGYYTQDIDGPVIKAHTLSVGGLVGYDFGTVTVQAYATREVLVHNGGWGLGTPAGQTSVPNGSRDYDTRGYLRLVVPLYVAPAASPPVVARY